MALLAKPLQMNTAEAGFEAAFAARLHWSAETDAAISARDECDFSGQVEG
jgi:histidinol dehydrogenase